MSELAQFRPGFVRRQSQPFQFERASVSLLSTLKARPAVVADTASRSEWRDPVTLWGAR